MSRPSLGASGCAEFRALQCNRRELIRLGGLTGLGLLLPDLLRARAEAPQRQPAGTTFGRARSVIMIYLHGGPAQQETWDPKPDGPAPERGEFGAIATSVPGVCFGELLPESARLMHKIAVIRSLSHPNANHVQAALPAMTGHHHPPAPSRAATSPRHPPTSPPSARCSIICGRPQGSRPGSRSARR